MIQFRKNCTFVLFITFFHISGLSFSSSLADLRCPVLLDPANGVIDVMGTTSGSSAVFSCMGGFGINGSRVLRCLDDGTWSPAPPTCIAVSSVTCPELPNPVDGLVNVGSRNLNNVATYGCASGFSLEGAGLRICLVSEMWSGVAPTCQRESQLLLFVVVCV